MFRAASLIAAATHPLMDWMNNNGLAAEVIKWIDKLPPGLTSSGAVATAVAEAFSQSRNWSRLRRWTRNGNWGAEDYLRLAYQSHATRQLRQAVADGSGLGEDTGVGLGLGEGLEDALCVASGEGDATARGR